MRKLIIFIAIAVLAATIGYGTDISSTTGKITGTVNDAEDSQPVVGARVVIEGTTMGSIVNPMDGSYIIDSIPPGEYTLIASCIGYKAETVKGIIVKAGETTKFDFQLEAESIEIGEILIVAEEPDISKFETSTVDRLSTKEIESLPLQNIQGIVKMQAGLISQDGALHNRGSRTNEPSKNLQRSMQNMRDYRWNTESYVRIVENEFKDALTNPLSTFSIDVDAASYSNIRRFINGGSLPPTDAIRLEEMINYFDYDYPQPAGDLPFSIITEISECPWNAGHRLVHIGLQGRDIETENLPPSNLVFLIDVSGSMQPANKLPLLKSSLKLLVDKLRPQDRVAIVTYAGHAGLLLESTPGNQKQKIKGAISSLGAGGCTAGAEGIITAYEIAKKYYQEEGNNRVILATDGDFNIGVSSDAEMTELIEHKRKEGIFLTVLGFGTGNYKDSKMEILADKGNGNYAYIDNIMEAQKVLVNEIGGTLFTIAKDVKIQIEFNPVRVKAYRLVGYENRLLAKEDFDDDTKDAGELGAGHTVTALYEIVPAGSDEEVAIVGDLKYQETSLKSDAYNNHELMTVKLRYKKPDEDESKLLVQVALDQNTKPKKTSDNFRFSAAVAEWGMLLRDSQFKGNGTFDQVLDLANGAKGDDVNGYRAEFIQLVKTSMALDGALAGN